MKFGDVFPPFRFRMLKRRFKGDAPNILDIGCASGSPQIAKRAFPRGHYTAIDITQPDGDMLPYIDRFIQMDAGSLDYSALADDNFDIVILSHVLEHIRNGEAVLAALLSKVKVGGTVYVEYPSAKSLGLPSAINTLQFCDDDTHVRMYSLVNIANILLDGGFKVVDGGIRRDWPRILFFPLAIPNQIVSLLKYGKLNSKGLWDITGFAEFAIGVRDKSPIHSIHC